MKILKLKDMVGGWFVGDFTPTMYTSKHVEVGIKSHSMGDWWPAHYQKVATEVNCLLRGRMELGSQIVHAGDIVLVEPGEVVRPRFLEDCEVVVVKLPAAGPRDKVIVGG